MKRMTVVFVAGMLAGGTMAYVFRPAQTVVRVAPGSSAVSADSEAPEISLDEPAPIESPAERRGAARDAIGLFDALPALERGRLAPQFAARLAALDPDAAIEWARSARLPRVFDEALAVLADSDPYRALELAVEAGGSTSLDRVVRAAMESSATTMTELADALLSVSPGSLRLVADTWAERDPETALDWMLALPSDESSSFLSAAMTKLQDNPLLAERYLDRVPRQVRPLWLRMTARAYAMTDPALALDWVERFRGLGDYVNLNGVILPIERDYLAAQREVIISIATYDGASAAALIESRALWSDRNLVLAVVDRWSYYDPDAASAWAANR